MHEGKELIYVKSAYASGWVTTVGENIDTIERLAAEYIGVRHAVALTCGTAAIHLAVKLAAEKLYHSSTVHPQAAAMAEAYWGNGYFALT